MALTEHDSFDAVENQRPSEDRKYAESVHTKMATRCPMSWCLLGLNAAALFSLPVAFSSQYPYHLENLGALWGSFVFSGQWWRLLTYSFIHFDLFHFSVNMVGLWVLGRRMEREFGSWVFLLFYMFCGIVAGLSLLGFRPEIASNGASGAIAGTAGGIFAIYAARWQSLQWRTRGKLLLLSLYICFA